MEAAAAVAVWQRVRHWAGVATYMHQSRLTWLRFRTWLRRLVSLHHFPLEECVAIWLANQLTTCIPPTLLTYARQLHFQSTLQGLPPLLKAPAIHHVIQSAYNMVYAQAPMETWQAAALHPEDLRTLETSAAPVWLKNLFALADLIASRLKDLLGPMSLIDVPAHTLLPPHEELANPALANAPAVHGAPAALLKIYHHKTSGRGRKAPPLVLPVPPHPVLEFLRRRARPHPTLFFPECPSTAAALRLARQHIPNPHRPIHSYSARIAGMQRLGSHLPDSAVQRTVGHSNLRTTQHYLRNSLTWSQRRSVSMVSRIPRHQH